MKNLSLASFGLAIAAATSLAPVAASAEQLRVGLAALATSVDPHFHRAGYNFDLRENISDALVYANGVNGGVEPRLAKSWEIQGDTKWVITLESKAKFDDGNPLGADDVIYSMCRVRNVPNSPGLFSSFISTISGIKDAGDGKIEIDTKKPDPNLLRSLSNIGIVENPTGRTLTYDDKTCGNDNWLETAGFNNGKVSPGIGHYRVRKFTPDVQIELERNAQYYGTPAAYDSVLVKSLPDNSARIAALLGGAVDVINAVPINAIDSIQSSGKHHLSSMPSTLLIFLLPDQGQEKTPKVSGTNGKNPFLDARVRKALNLAINREQIAETVMGGMAGPASQIIVDGVFGHNPDLQPSPFDPQEAKRLLAEAGYPNGFSLTLNAPSDRYVNGAQVAQAVTAMLSQIGLNVTLETFPFSIYFTKASAYEFSLYLAGAAADTGEGLSQMINLAGTRNPDRGWGGANRGRYSSKVTDKALEDAQSTLDDAKREELIRSAVAQVYKDDGYVPLYHEFGVWGVRNGVHYDANANLTNIFYTARPE
ncbi:Peptide ABC transporter, periplasmic peptide-binding protein [Neorhizobium galegae bv. officinalis bv. officinalis str. HAMBI 1141]|uniref:Peptide ABC transporter, periplasmic peptide-binding protein n=1 Tax=Neorhizobium galegae bv. officinalis bv. officinalis str. HAMBI 1141 TaxID=1028801 RepID=A0A068T833_NEOGA|nr:ABC transporter substrate-binding protein [Neorhizobium galegae]CDN54221.1 Peptide ABC transporter, periplasmic peptide-binding protein [Neorhizobium galegae bv. officinalis bv. officinalis str. HAMBI 1141]